MYRIFNAEVLRKSDTLDQAMQIAKEIGQFVTITDGVTEIVGVFGADAVCNGLCPNGTLYTWKKRRI